MPRNVRNFWLELNVDGASKRIETGPRAKDGGFHLRILQRHNGGIIEGITLRGSVDDTGKLELWATTPGDPHILKVETKR